MGQNYTRYTPYTLRKKICWMKKSFVGSSIYYLFTIKYLIDPSKSFSWFYKMNNLVDSTKHLVLDENFVSLNQILLWKQSNDFVRLPIFFFLSVLLAVLIPNFRRTIWNLSRRSAHFILWRCKHQRSVPALPRI